MFSLVTCTHFRGSLGHEFIDCLLSRSVSVGGQLVLLLGGFFSFFLFRKVLGISLGHSSTDVGTILSTFVPQG